MAGMDADKGRMAEFLQSYRDRTLGILKAVDLEQVAQIIQVLREARASGHQLFICGNGGSAATSSHFANDLGKGASFGRERRFRVLSLTDCTPWITALANDTDYSRVFVEQLRNWANEGDVLLVFSGSGNSSNILETVRWANQAGLITIGLTGRPGGELARLARLLIQIESDHMGTIEDGHFFVQHLIGYYFMEQDFE